MITKNDYASYLSKDGKSLGWIRKTRSDKIMNAMFTGDTGYKKVYILDPDEGWKYTDARYSKHAIQSIQRDEVDYYLQFRPQEHYPVGAYVFIPDDTEEELTNINEEDPLNGDTSNLWIIVQRNDTKQFVRYLVLKVNYEFRWLKGYNDNKRIFKCWGIVRNSNSYTSGIWNDYYVTSLDNITSAWFPDTHKIYTAEKLVEYNLVDTRLITHQMRFMITNNDLHPNCWMVSKVNDMTPQGIIKITLKQDDFNPKRDNIELRICDYYSDEGDILVPKPDPSEPVDPNHPSFIVKMSPLENGELFWDYTNIPLEIGKTYYYYCWFSDDSLKRRWRINLVDEDNEYTDDERIALEHLMVIREYSYNTIQIKLGKSNKIKGKTFKLIVSDIDGDHEATLDLEVAE